MTKKENSEEAMTLGELLKALRGAKNLTLREVEEATDKDVSNAYLSQLENGKIVKPSPNILHSLAEIYGASYEVLMEKAGYIVADTSRKDHEKHGRIATFAVEDLTKAEEAELIDYLRFMRSRKGKAG